MAPAEPYNSVVHRVPQTMPERQIQNVTDVSRGGIGHSRWHEDFLARLPIILTLFQGPTEEQYVYPHTVGYAEHIN